MERKYTVFVDAESGWKGHSSPDHIHDLQKVIEYAAEPTDWGGKFTPVAWMLGRIIHSTSVACRAESIAAGRVIEFVDGKYIPRGTPEANAEEAQALQRMERNRTREVADRNCAMRPSDEIPPAPLPVEKVGGFDAFKGWPEVIKHAVPQPQPAGYFSPDIGSTSHQVHYEHGSAVWAGEKRKV